MTNPDIDFSTTNNLLLIDSGVGGLSIVSEIVKKAPALNIHYIADNAFYPYGIKSEAEIIERVSLLAQRFIEKQQYSALILACNTASTVSLPQLRSILKIPVIGVVPAIKPAAISSQSKVIGLLATPRTVQGQYAQDLINTFASDCKVIKVASNELVDLTETMLEQGDIDEVPFSKVLQPFWDHPHAEQLDTIILGCTHFPLVKQQLQRAAKKPIHWVDSGEAIAKQILRILSIKKPQPESSQVELEQGQRCLYFTQSKPVSANLTHSLKTHGIDEINFVNY